MPVRKFRSVAEMDGPPWHAPGDPALFTAMRSLWKLAERTTRPRFPPGVYKHRSMESMNALADEWSDANFARYHERLAREHEHLAAGTPVSGGKSRSKA